MFDRPPSPRAKECSNMENFMNRLKKEIDRGVTIVGAKSKELLETTKIKSRISDLNNQKQQSLEEIGKLTYQMFSNPNYDGGTAIQDKCRFVAELEEEIQLKEDELEKIRQATGESIHKTEGPARYWDVKPEDAEVGPIIDITPTSADNKAKGPSPVPEAVIAEVIAERSPGPAAGAASQPEKPTSEANPDAADAACQPKKPTSEANPSGTADAACQPEKTTSEANPEPMAGAACQPEKTTSEANPDAAGAACQPEKPTSKANPDAAGAACQPEKPTSKANPDAAGAECQPEKITPEANPSGTADSDGTTPSPVGPWKMLCETCFSIIDENSKFCSNCGTRLK
jgi:hypothetical protein